MKGFLLYLALDVTANPICEIHYLAPGGFDLNTVHKPSSKEKILAEQGFEPGLLGGKQECFICATLKVMAVVMALVLEVGQAFSVQSIDEALTNCQVSSQFQCYSTILTWSK